MRSRAGWLLRVAAGIALFVIAFRDVDLRALGAAFRLANPVLIAISITTVFVTVAIVVLRWRMLLGGAAPGTWRVLFAAVIASQVANIVAPFKLGDAVRVGAVSRALRIPMARTLMSVAVERVFDVLAVGAAAGLLVATGALPAMARAGLASVAAGVALITVSALVGYVRRDRIEPMWRAIAQRLPNAIASRVDGQVRLAAGGVSHVASPPIAAAAFAATGAVLASSMVTAYIVMRAFDLQLPIAVAAVLVVVLQVGGAVVPVPGAIGVSQVITVETLRLWQVAEEPALAYALMLYLVARVPKLLALPFLMPLLSTAGSD